MDRDRTRSAGATPVGRSVRSLGIVGVAALVILLGGCSSVTSPGHRVTTTTAATTTTPSGASTTTSPSTTTTTTTTSSTTTTTTAPGPNLGPGATGPAVLALQKRLVALGYWLGTPDGVFGDSTEQAVYALQKAAGIGRDGIVGPKTRAALAAGAVPHPRPAPGYLIEVDLQDDLLMIVSNGRLEDVLNTSTGGGYLYTSEGVTAIADTPIGRFTIYREVDGLVVDPLGELWRPKFFEDGFAIHGDSYVPPEPVSHGCIRVSNEAIDWIWANGIAPIGTAVWVYD